jgi:DNA-binding YbaB/EbfC family protein
MDFNNILKQAQNAKESFEKQKTEFDSKEFSGDAGGGAVSAVISGEGKVLKLELNDNLLEEKDKTLIQDLIIAAINNAKDSANKESKNMMSDIGGGLNLPGMGNLFGS